MVRIRKMKDPYAKIKRHLRSVTPQGHVRRLASIRRITPEEPFYGYWSDIPKEGMIACCGSAVDKIKVDQGFATSYGGHHFGGGVYVGQNISDVIDYLAATEALPLGKAYTAFKTGLEQLECGTIDKAYFDHPKRTAVLPIFVVDEAVATMSAKIEGPGSPVVSWSTTPIRDGEERRFNREIAVGDKLVVGDEVEHLEFFVPGEEGERYRIAA